MLIFERLVGDILFVSNERPDVLKGCKLDEFRSMHYSCAILWCDVDVVLCTYLILSGLEIL